MRVIDYRSNKTGDRTGLLIDTGRKYHRVILMDYPIRIIKVPIDADFKEVEYHGKPYPVARAVRHIRHAIKTWHGGIRNVSKATREALTQ